MSKNGKSEGKDVARGTRIRRLRKALEWNQEQFAQEIGVDQSTVSDIENGAGFSAEVLMRMAEKLRVPPGVVMRDHDMSVWPFPHVHFARVIALQPEDLGYVEGKLSAALDEVSGPTTEDLLLHQRAHRAPAKRSQGRKRA